MSKQLNVTITKPTIILTGFLGSGKTTYLNRLLEQNQDIRYAIIENEYGKEGVDSGLILSSENDIVELNDGCLCCTLNDNLYDILNKLYLRRKDFDQLIIEATGLADPRGIASPFLTNPSIKKLFPLAAIVCLVDAELIEEQLSETVEAIHQITYSDILLVNKIDLIDEKYGRELITRLRKINPLAKIISGQFGKFPLIELSSSEVSNREQKFDNHHHHTEVVTHTFTFQQPFDLQKLYLRLTAFLMFQSKDLYRMKGTISVIQSKKQHLIQSVGKRLSIDEIENKKTGSESKIIIIGRKLKREGFEKMLNQCLYNKYVTSPHE